VNAALDPDPAVPGVAVVVAAGAPAPAAENVKECIRKEERKCQEEIEQDRWVWVR